MFIVVQLVVLNCLNSLYPESMSVIYLLQCQRSRPSLFSSYSSSTVIQKSRDPCMDSNSFVKGKLAKIWSGSLVGSTATLNSSLVALASASLSGVAAVTISLGHSFGLVNHKSPFHNSWFPLTKSSSTSQVCRVILASKMTPSEVWISFHLSHTICKQIVYILLLPLAIATPPCCLTVHRIPKQEFHWALVGRSSTDFLPCGKKLDLCEVCLNPSWPILLCTCRNKSRLSVEFHTAVLISLLKCNFVDTDRHFGNRPIRLEIMKNIYIVV